MEESSEKPTTPPGDVIIVEDKIKPSNVEHPPPKQESFICPVPKCGFETEEISSIQNHLIEVHHLKKNFDEFLEASRQKNKSFACEKCSYIAESNFHLKAHEILIHNLDAEGPFLCPWPWCPAVLQVRFTLKRHVECMHKFSVEAENKGRVVKVLDWTKSDDEELELEVEQNDLLLKKAEFLTCQECSFETSNKFTLDVHEQVVHKGKFYRCPHASCAFQSKYRSNFSRHLLKIHNFELDNVFSKENVTLQKSEVSSRVLEPAISLSTEDSDPDWDPIFDTAPPKRTKTLVGAAQDLDILHFSKTKYACPSLYCLFDTDTKMDIRKHLKVFHNIAEDTIRKMENTIVSIRKNACLKCNFESVDKEGFIEHFLSSHAELMPNVTGFEGYECLECTFKSSDEKEAYMHGSGHCSKNVSSVVFYNYSENKRPVAVRFRYPGNFSDRYRCMKCQHVDSTSDGLHRHHMLWHNSEGSHLSQITIEDEASKSSEIIRIEIVEDAKDLQEESEDVCQGFVVQEPNLPKPSAKRKKSPDNQTIVKKKSEGAPGKISFRCLLCGDIILCYQTLRNHTYIHAREEGNFNIKVRYTKFIGDVQMGTIVKEADLSYVPRKSQNVPLKSRQKTKSPVLEYDPNLPVFGCTECNFKTNDESSFEKHKNLHWTAEKAEAYKANRWFRCGMCSFHCLDSKALTRHREKHK